MFGKVTTNCITEVCRPFGYCYEPCEHQNDVRALMSEKITAEYEPFLDDYLVALLKVQEEFIKCLCEPEDLSTQAYFLGLNPIQCVNTDFDTCGELCNDRFLWSITWSGEQYIDLSTHPEFEAFLKFIECAKGRCVDQELMNEYFAIFGGEITGIDHGCYYIEFAAMPTFPISAIDNLAPRPIGGCFVYYLAE